MPPAERLSVSVCRGCCCGRPSKHPDVDHAAQLLTVRDATYTVANARFWEVDCLGPCDRSNVVVVRSHGVRTWLGGILEPEVTAAVAGWVRSGAHLPPPPALAERVFDPQP